MEVKKFQLSYFKILKDDAVKVLHSICQKIWKTQQWPQDWRRSVFIKIPKKVNAPKLSNYCTIDLTLHVSKLMLKILQARLEQYMNCELTGVQTEFRKCREIEENNRMGKTRDLFKKIRDTKGTSHAHMGK